MLIGSQDLKPLNSIEKIQPKMMIATFNGYPSTTIITCYSPTNKELSSLVRCIPKHDILVIGGDMNAQNGENVHRKFSFNNSSKWGTFQRFHARKKINTPQYYMSEKKRKTMDIHLR